MSDWRRSLPERRVSTGEADAGVIGKPEAKKVYYFPSTGVMTAADGQFSLACKGGNNGESHNHNDVGSVILYKDRKPFLIDLGVETYTAKTFSPERYRIWTMQSGYHNLPSFILADGTCIQQKDGEEYAAADVRCSIREEKTTISMEISGAYPVRKEDVAGYWRTVCFHKGSGIEIRDKAEMGEGVHFVLSLMTYERLEIVPVGAENGGNVTIMVGNLGKMIISGADEVRKEEIPVSDPRLGIMWKHSVYRILIRAAGDALDIQIPEE